MYQLVREAFLNPGLDSSIQRSLDYQPGKDALRAHSLGRIGPNDARAVYRCGVTVAS